MTGDDTRIDWRTKGFWWPGPAVPADEFVTARHRIFDGAFTWPLMVARRSALDHNVRTLAEFCDRHGLLFAPHGKTTMAPSLFAAQLAAGAWGITAATANQVLALRAVGVPRVLLANQLLDAAPLRWLAGEVDRGFECYVQIDSAASVAALAATAGERPVRVLVELGYPGGRNGCRSVAELVEVARAAAAAPRVALAGVAAYEGGLPGVDAVRAYFDNAREATVALAKEDLLPDEVLFACGGSQYFDVVAQRFGTAAGAWLPGHTVRTVLRGGAYVSHDDGFYRERTPYRRIPHEGHLDAALAVWAQVTSVPEPGLAIVGLGKREVSYDEGLPVPQVVRRPDGTVTDAAGLRVNRLNDHHMFLDVGPGRGVVPGDLIRFGISHPCTAFDHWSVIPVVDDDDTVVDLIRTYF